MTEVGAHFLNHNKGGATVGRKLKQASKFFVLFIVAFGLSACSGGAPKCSAPETIELVKQIVKKELAKSLDQEKINQLEISVDAIRTTDSNEKTGAQQCAAQLKFKGSGGESTHDITYTCEKMDKGDEFYVTVYGL